MWTVLSPYVPMLFMGEEHGERRPFQFFTDHIDPFIADATREGRRREFAAFTAFSEEEIPDPQDPETARRSVIDPDGGDPAVRELYRRLLALRRELPGDAPRVRSDAVAGWIGLARGAVEMVGNFGRRRGGGAGGRTGRGAGDARGRRPPGRRAAAAAAGRGGGAMTVWPGRPFPLGATWDGDGDELRAVLRARRPRRAVPVRRRRTARRAST